MYAFSKTEKILCVDPSGDARARVAQALPDATILGAESIETARLQMGTRDLVGIVLELDQPDGDGLDLLTEITLNKQLQFTPVIVVSHRNETKDKVSAFQLGAEDYICKPYDNLELQARMSARVRRSQRYRLSTQQRNIGQVCLDFDRQTAIAAVESNEIDLHLTGIEFKLLAFLGRNPGQAISRTRLRSEIWGKTTILDRTVDSHIAHLRQKLARTNIAIETAKNEGYAIRVRSTQTR